MKKNSNTALRNGDVEGKNRNGITTSSPLVLLVSSFSLKLAQQAESLQLPEKYGNSHPGVFAESWEPAEQAKTRRTIRELAVGIYFSLEGSVRVQL